MLEIRYIRKRILLIVAFFGLQYHLYGEIMSNHLIEDLDKDSSLCSLMLPEWKELKNIHMSPILEGSFTDNSSLYKLTALFMYPKANFTRKERKQIESLLEALPDSIVNNDTTAFIAQCAAKITYYEFVKRNNKKVIEELNYCYRYYNNKLDAIQNFLTIPSFIYYTEVRAKSRTVKNKQHCNKVSWSSVNVSFGENHLVNILASIPMNLEIDTYRIFLGILFTERIVEDEILSFLISTIHYNRFDIAKLVLDNWAIVPSRHTERNLILLALLSSSDLFDNKTASIYFRELFPNKYLQNYDNRNGTIMNYEKDVIENLLNGVGYKWFNLINRVKNGYGYTDNYIKDLIKNIFGESSNEYDYIKRDYEDFLDIVMEDRIESTIKKDISIGLEDSVTSGRIVNYLDLLYTRCQYESVVQNCKLYEALIQKIHVSTFYNLWGLSEIHMGLLSESIIHFRKAIEYANADIKTFEQNLAYALCESGKYQDAVSIFYKHLHQCENDFDRFCINDKLGYAFSYFNKQQALIHYTEAEKYIDYNDILHIEKIVKYYLGFSRLFEENSYLQRKYISKAITLHYNHLNLLPSDNNMIRTRPDSVIAGRINTELGLYYNSILNYIKAEEHYKFAGTYFQVLSLKDREVRLSVKNHAKNLYDSKEFYKCIERLTELKKIESEVLGKEHVDYLRTLRLLLLATIANEDAFTAQQLYDEYIEITPLHSFEVNTLEHFQVLYSYQKLIGNPNKAIEILENCVLSSQMDSKILTFSNELIALTSRYKPERSEYINNAVMEKTKELVTYHFTKMSRLDRVNWQVPLYSIRSQLINTLTENRTLQNIAFDFSLYSKNLLFFTQSKFDKELSKSKKNRNVMSELKTMRDSLNAAISKGDYVRMKKIEGEIESKERELYQSIQLKNPYDIKTGDVLSSLGKKELAVDFVQYESPEKEKKYGAFLLSHDLESPIFIELCNDDLIRNIAIDEKGNIQNDFSKNIASYELIWKNIIPYLSDYENIYFSGDGLLNQLGIEYICNESGERICENYRIHRVFHLANIKRTEGIGNNFVGIGVADHNSPINDSISIVDRGSWDNLNGIKQEFSTIRKSLDAHSECKTLFMIDDDAREKRIKELDNSSVTALHIATHGFYKDKKELWEAANDSTHFDHHISCRALGANKESLSGLVLRQGNISWKSATITDEYDDLLTNDEIENMTFPNLKLTVLSACDTGLGDVDSEGVWGLQRAFRIAGTESLICSLSKISDKWTAKFMEIFYEEVASGENIYDAFHIAQNYLYQKNRRKPEIWSSMILIE